MNLRASHRLRPFIMAAVVVPVLAAGLAGCGSDEVPGGTDLASRLLPGDAMPDGFTVVPMPVDDLIANNRSTLEQSRSVGFEPQQCRPTADAEFNPRLHEGNTVLIVGQGSDGTVSELLSTVSRNVDADRRATTGPCAVTTAIPSTGALSGARITTTTTPIESPTGPAGDGTGGRVVEQALVVRSDSVTRLPDGGIRARSAFMANLLVRAADGRTFTLQVAAGGPDGVVAPERVASTPAGGALAEPPISQDRFVELVTAAVERAARA